MLPHLVAYIVPFYIATNNVRDFKFPHIPANAFFKIIAILTGVR